MKILVTGAAGFLGRQLIECLITRQSLTDRNGQQRAISQIIACDVVPLEGISDARVKVVCGDIADRQWLASIIDPQIDSIFHLAAIVSGQAEQDFDLGMRINVDATRHLFELARAAGNGPKVVITSSVAVFGGALPQVVPDEQVWMPQSSYGTQKALNDLLLADYSRRGFIDGRSLRMPTIAVRPGKPNQAASSFVSGIIREPLQGITAICPVNPQTQLWLLSPAKAIENLILGHELDAASLTQGRVINLPGLSVSVQQMLDSLRKIAGDNIANLVRLEPDEKIEKIVNSWPGDFEATYAKHLGFSGEQHVDNLINGFIKTLK